MKNRPRLSLAVALSVGAHAALLAAAVGSSLIGAWPATPIEIEIAGTKAEDVTDLPLGVAAPAGAPPPAAPPPPAEPAEPGPPPPRRREPKPRAAEDTAAPEDRAPLAPPRPQSVRSYGPAGSRVTALLRVDRLRGTPYASSVDALLLRLPDRRDLLEGTSLDLYRDVDALLIATPNPLDPAVTFLAVRHRLTDGALRDELERGARATGRTLKWRTERGRPFAERLRASATPGGAPDWRGRDHRLILLPAPKLAVVTPPAYRSLILRGGAAVRRPVLQDGNAGAGQGGAGGAGGVGAGGMSGGAGGPGGASGADTAEGAAGGARDEHADWAALVRRIDAEDSIMPPDAVVMFSAEDIFADPRAGGGGRLVAGTRGSVDDDGGRQARGASAIFGLPAPRLLTATLGITPEPFSNADLTFFEESDASRWEAAWPELRQKLRSNPLVVLTGFSGLLGRITLDREAAVLHVHVQATEMELVRLLQLLSTQMFPLGSGG